MLNLWASMICLATQRVPTNPNLRPWQQKVKGLLRQITRLEKHNRMLANVCSHYEEMVHHGFKLAREERRARAGKT